MSQTERIARTVITIVVMLLVPLALFLTSLRLALNPAFLTFEYNQASFPADLFGFTKEDRLRLAPLALDYLTNDQDISFLSTQKFADGTPVYNERELSHMEDVKELVQLALRVWTAVLGLLIGLGLAAWGAKWSRDYRLGLARGGWLTVGLIVLLLLVVAVSFRQLFTAFHRVFFEGDTWLFLWSDTLIRLFPLKFWQDAFILVGGLTLLGGLALGLIFSWTLRRDRPTTTLAQR